MVRTNEPTITGVLPYELRGDDGYIGAKVIGVLSPIGQLGGTIATGVKARPYEGPYTVTSQPYVDMQLSIKNKMAESDIIVKAIPFLKINDESGGEIAIIGKEV